MTLGELLYNRLRDLDLVLLRMFNTVLSDDWLDEFWLTITHLERQAWFIYGALPAFLLGLVYIYRTQAFKPLLALGLAVALADMLAYRVLKILVQRPRPFENPEIESWLRHVGDAHGPSFPSNHAANCFAGAVVLTWYFPRLRNLFYILALLIGVSRIALGVHYPSDVVAGAMLGILVGSLVKFRLLSRYLWFDLKNPVSREDGNSSGWRSRTRRPEDD